jgi:hypothetical protein
VFVPVLKIWGLNLSTARVVESNPTKSYTHHVLVSCPNFTDARLHPALPHRFLRKKGDAGQVVVEICAGKMQSKEHVTQKLSGIIPEAPVPGKRR